MNIILNCTENIENRIKCLDDIKDDSFFREIDWDEIKNDKQQSQSVAAT